MPAEGIHLTALREAMGAPSVDAPVRRLLVCRDDAARFGATLLDLPYFHRYAVEVVRYVMGLPARASSWGAAIHEGGAVALLGSLLAIARRERDDLLGAIALGLASHCAIDRALHPLINAPARLHRGGGSHDASHREIEKFQSICFHEQYLGRDAMGTPGITAYLTIHLTAQLDDSAEPMAREAWAAALGDAPGAGEMVGSCGAIGGTRGCWVRRSASGRAAGCQGRGAPEVPARCTRRLRRAARRCHRRVDRDRERRRAVLEAGDRDADAARSALKGLLPAGTIDPQGTALDLARPVEISLRAA